MLACACACASCVGQLGDASTRDKVKSAINKCTGRAVEDLSEELKKRHGGVLFDRKLDIALPFV